jgi:hypothetical protein
MSGLVAGVQIQMPTRMAARRIESGFFKEQGTHRNSFINEPKPRANRFIM